VNELALFAGAGGGILGGKLLGWSTVCAVEIDAYCRRVLLARQKDGILPRFPIWDDVKTFDGNQWRGRVDVVSGGFPCQDISCAGKGEGIEGQRSGLWTEMARIIGEVQPPFVLVENSPMLVIRGFWRVLGDLATLGYDARWGVLGANQVGASHVRKRLWILAYPMRSGLQTIEKTAIGFKGAESIYRQRAYGDLSRDLPLKWEDIDRNCPPLRKGDVVAHWMDRLTAIGNGQVSAVVALAWNILSGTRNRWEGE